MHSLSYLTPLGGKTARIDKLVGLVIAEVPDRSLVALTARQDQSAAVLRLAGKFLGFPLPGVGGSAAGDRYSAFWIAPSSWMIDAAFAENADPEFDLKAALGSAASVVDQSDAWCRFDVSGPASPDSFERLCAVPVRRTITGAVTRTLIEHMGCFLWCHAPLSNYSVLGPRSSARSLHNALISMARSIT